MPNAYVPFSEIAKALAQRCKEGATGTFFVATDANRSAQIMLERGEIVYLYYANKRGVDALAVIPAITAGRYSFQEGSIGDARMDLPTTASILAELHRAGASADEVPSSTAAHPLTAHERKILRACLAEFVGPIAELVCDDHFDEAADLPSAVDALATEIASPSAAQEFRTLVAEQLG